MKKIIISLALISGLTPFFAFAVSNTFKDLMQNVVINQFIKPVVPILTGLLIIVFIWGVIKFIRAEDSTKIEEGKQFMLWGVIAIAVVFSIWGLVAVLQKTFDLNSTTKIPTNIDLNNLTTP